MATVNSRTVRTSRLTTHLLEAGDRQAPTLVLVHGNVSSADFFAEAIGRLGERWHCLAPDLRGFGDTERVPVDATRGLADYAEDLHELLDELAVTGNGRRVALLGWSLGGGVVLRYAQDRRDHVAAIVLEAPMSPYGFGATRDETGTPCTDDHAGSGGGTANAELVRLIAAGDRSEEHDASPRRVVTSLYVRPPAALEPAHLDRLVDGMLRMATGPDFYPGDAVTSPNWPGTAPGTRGVNNAISPRYCDLSGFGALTDGPDVLWVRGDSDQIVSDNSLADLGTLGQLGVVPGWPGAEVYPPQPMVSQLRAVLTEYAARGGRFTERVLTDCGHSPHLEQPELFESLVTEFLSAAFAQRS